VTVTQIHKDPEALTMTITSEFAAPIDRVWKLWEDPRQLERWWGPPTYPATFVEHDLSLGGAVTYYMTGPEGDRHGGWWRVIGIDPPHQLEFEDGFADESGKPNPELPTTIATVKLSEQPDGRTRMEIEAKFPSREAMEQMVAMGMEEGLAASIGQIDELLLSHNAPR
jgi:uncharacterized protein YndB with AHSA1/START domain